MTDMKGADSVLRAMTDDGAFRVITTRTTDTVARTLSAQAVTGTTGRRLGELLTGAVLVRETMAPTHRVQALYWTGDRAGRLVADSHPDGGTRGLVGHTDGTRTVPFGGGTLEMMRTLRSGALHRGLVQVRPGTGMSAALMTYMAESEQVVSMISVACELDGDEVSAAGGYIVQLLPEVGRGPLAIMTERLRDFEEVGELLVQTDAAPDLLLEELLLGMAFTRLDESPVRFRCRCSDVRVIAGLATVGRDEIGRMVEENRPIDVSCEYCGKHYEVSPQQLKGLLQAS